MGLFSKNNQSREEGTLPELPELPRAPNPSFHPTLPPESEIPNVPPGLPKIETQSLPTIGGRNFKRDNNQELIKQTINYPNTRMHEQPSEEDYEDVYAGGYEDYENPEEINDYMSIQKPLPRIDNEKRTYELPDSPREKRTYEMPEPNFRQRERFDSPSTRLPPSRFRKPERIEPPPVRPSLMERLELSQKQLNPSSIQNEKKTEPVFIRLDKFQTTIETFESIKSKIKEIENLLTQIREIKTKEEQELLEWEKEIQILKSRVDLIDSDVFNKLG